MGNYIQQNEGACLFKCSSFIDLTSSANYYLQSGFYLQKIISDTTVKSFIELAQQKFF
jgi:hypothetical protein